MNFPWKIKLISGIKLDLLANFAGVGWSALVQIVCVPLYIKFLGIEAYGLIGFYLVLTALLQVLDLGLSPTMNREMARYSVQPEKAAEARDLVRTLEVSYWLIGILIGGAILWASPWLSTNWIKAGTFPIRSVQQAVMVMGILAFFQWPISFYHGGLMGLGRQTLFNVLRICLVTANYGGALLVLWLISPTIQAFFLWMAAMSAVKAFVLAAFLWKSLPAADRAPRFDSKLLRNIWRFAAGMSGITAFALLLTQSDKIILSRLFSLRVFGYYTVAGIFGSGLSMIVGSVFNTIFPRFSALAAAGNEEALRQLYHRCTQLMAVLILPVAAVVVLFSTDILQLWTKNAEVARNAGPIASLLVIGSALNGLMNLPYALQLAYGWTSLGLKITVFLTIAIVPAIWFMATTYGPLGAAWVWFGLNVIYMAIGVPLTHRRLLKGDAWRWLGDVSLPLVPVLLIVFAVRGLLGASSSTPGAIYVLLGMLISAIVAAGLVSPSIRPWMINQALKAKVYVTTT